MRICGVELTGNDAVVCLLYLEDQEFNIPDSRVRKLALPKNHTRADLQKFQFAFAKLMSDYKIDKVAIKERMTGGKFAGGAISFKLESAIQLITELDVVVLSPTQIKSTLSKHPLPVSYSDAGLKVFQQAAFTVSYVAHMME